VSLTVYGLARSRASRSLWMLEETGTPYRHISIVHGPEGIRSPAFLRINPYGRVPTLVDGELIMWESLAINLHLAKRYGGALGPQNADEDAHMTMWSLWTATEVEMTAHEVYVHTLREPPALRNPASVATAVSQLAAPLQALEQAIRGGDGYLVGRRFTVADLNLASVLFYLRGLPGAFDATPHAAAWYARCSSRAAFKRMEQLRNDDEPGDMS
jgi:glutathione S-transferase